MAEVSIVTLGIMAFIVGYFPDITNLEIIAFIVDYFPDIANLGIYINGICIGLIALSIIIPDDK